MGTTKATENRARETDRAFREITAREASEKQAKSARLRAERERVLNTNAGTDQERGPNEHQG